MVDIPRTSHEARPIGLPRWRFRSVDPVRRRRKREAKAGTNSSDLKIIRWRTPVFDRPAQVPGQSRPLCLLKPVWQSRPPAGRPWRVPPCSLSRLRWSRPLRLTPLSDKTTRNGVSRPPSGDAAGAGGEGRGAHAQVVACVNDADFQLATAKAAEIASRRRSGPHQTRMKHWGPQGRARRCTASHLVLGTRKGGAGDRSF